MAAEHGQRGRHFGFPTLFVPRRPRGLARIVVAAILTGWPLLSFGGTGEVHLADFEKGFPTASARRPGFLPKNQRMAAVLSGGAEGTAKYARLFLTSADRSVFFQYRRRRRYLVTGSSVYAAGGPNALRFWLRVSKSSQLLCGRPASRFGVWTYHRDPKDIWVGGVNGTSGTTDSMMHGYANICLAPGAKDRWIRVELSPSAFKQQRDYYHFYAARGVTGELEFFGSLRQFQFTLLGKIEGVQKVDMDDIELVRKEPTARFEPGYVRLAARASGGDIAVPFVLRNPTARARRYRVFVSSEIGAPRQALNRGFAETDSIDAPTAIQEALRAGGGMGAADVVPEGGGGPVSGKEIEIPAGGAWKGFLVHHLRPGMLGEEKEVTLGARSWHLRRDTLTTSVIAWDPDEPESKGMALVRAPASNSDDGVHPSPPGFPKQFRPPDGWRSEDVPLDQVGGYFVSEIELK